MTQTAIVAVRLDPEVKEGASKVAKSFGLDLTTAMRMFATAMYNTKTVPISLEKAPGQELTRNEYFAMLERGAEAVKAGRYSKRELVEV
ncbi:MAG: type II toxin-antitoxin system RelB/DinJ family antitoxin [Coriobacteriales bacterium]|nr:type II toxin-antitoxin system RelB/DinJ family antitoxin [Coriobacteriales bacterium]